MPALSQLPARLLSAAAVFEPRGRPLTIGRSLLALATLTTLLLTPDRDLFVSSPAWPAGPDCAGLRAATLWCVGPDAAGSFPVRRLVAIAVLCAVLAGVSPRWTCIPHWYVTASLGTTMTVPNGGDSAARIATLLLIPICLGDTRRWQWTAPAAPMAATWRGRAYAAALFVRLQVLTIYLYAVVTKLRVPGWRDGSYLGRVFDGPYYRVPTVLGVAGDVVRDQHWAISALTWGTLAIEVAIAVSMLGPLGWRRRALVMAIALHAGIALLMGIVSFSVVMVALVVLAGLRDTPGRYPAQPESGAGGSTDASPDSTRSAEPGAGGGRLSPPPAPAQVTRRNWCGRRYVAC